MAGKLSISSLCCVSPKKLVDSTVEHIYSWLQAAISNPPLSQTETRFSCLICSLIYYYTVWQAQKGKGEGRNFSRAWSTSHACVTQQEGGGFTASFSCDLRSWIMSPLPPPPLSAPNLPLVTSNSHSPEHFLVFPANSRWQESTVMFLKNSKCGQFICERKTLTCINIFAKRISA